MMNSYVKYFRSTRITILVITAIIGLYLTYSGYNSKINNRSHEILSFARIVKAAVNPDRLISLRGDESDVNNPDYQRLREQLDWIADSSDHVRYLYLMGYNPQKSPDKLFFYVDSQPGYINNTSTDPNDLAKPGEIYQETSQNLLDLFNMGGEYVSVVPETDKWGTFVSALLPIADRSSGKIVGLIGVDYEAKPQFQEILLHVAPRLLVLIFVLIFETVFLKTIKVRYLQDKSLFRMASILVDSNDAIYSTDLDGIITSWNNGAKKLFGYNENEIVGKHISVLVSEDQLLEQKNNLFSASVGKSIINQRTTRLHRNQKPIPVSLTVSPIKDNHNRVGGISVIARDISTEVREREIVDKKNREMESLNNLMINRELAMISLKSKIKELEAKLKTHK